MGLARASYGVSQSRHPLADRRDDRARRLHDGLASLNLVSGLSSFIGGKRTCETLDSQQFWAWRSRSQPVVTQRSNRACLVQARGPQARSSRAAMRPLGPSSAALATLLTAKPTQTVVNNTRAIRRMTPHSAVGTSVSAAFFVSALGAPSQTGRTLNV